MGFFSSEKKSQQESSAAPMAATIPGLGQGIGLVTDWMQRPQQFFPGQTYAGQTEAERQAIESLRAGAAAYPEMMGGVSAQTPEALSTLLGAPQAALGMGLQNVAENPALTAAAEAIQSRVNRNLQENILPQIRAGEVFGPSGAVGRGIAARGTSDVLSERLADLYGGAWQAGLGAETARYTAGLGSAAQALNLAPQAAEFALSQYTTPAALLSQAGGLERAEEQRAIDEEMARFQFQQMEPLTRASLGMGTLMEPAIAFGTSKGTARSEAEPSTFANIGNVLGALGGIGGLFG